MSADEIDNASQREQEDTAKAIAEAREAASKIEQGHPGECIQCGEDMPRLVMRMCCRCRDKYQR